MLKNSRIQIADREVRTANKGFCNIGADGITMSIFLYGICSGRRVSIRLFVVIFIISFSIIISTGRTEY